VNGPDFRQWLAYHRGAYPGLAAWLRTNADQLDHWERILCNVELHAAKSATDAIVASEDQPKGYGEHPRWVRRIAMAGQPMAERQQQLGPQVKDDRLVANCRHCMDYGVVSVLSPSCLRRVWQDDRHLHLTTCALACNCERGQRVRLPRWQDGHALIRIDDVLDQAINEAAQHADLKDAEWAVARRLLLEHHEKRQPSYAHDFDQWSAPEF